jgi:hypothetical protein
MKRKSSARGKRRAQNAGSMKQAKTKRKATEPSKASLREIPEVNFATSKVRRNPYAARIAREGIEVQIGRGRPKKLLEVGETEPRSVRFPAAIWKRLEGTAKKKGLTLHAALRKAILDWLKDVA